MEKRRGYDKEMCLKRGKNDDGGEIRYVKVEIVCVCVNRSLSSLYLRMFLTVYLGLHSTNISSSACVSVRLSNSARLPVSLRPLEQKMRHKHCGYCGNMKDNHSNIFVFMLLLF